MSNNYFKCEANIKMPCIVIHLKEISIRLRSDEDENTTTVISLCLSSIPSTDWTSPATLVCCWTEHGFSLILSHR